MLLAKSPDTGPAPVSIELQAAIEQIVGLITTGKALYSPVVLQAEGQYQALQIHVREPAEAGQLGKSLLEVSIYLENGSPGVAMDAAVIADGMISLAGNAARVITLAKRAELEAQKKDMAGEETGLSNSMGTPTGGPDSAAPTDQSSSN